MSDLLLIVGGAITASSALALLWTLTGWLMLKGAGPNTPGGPPGKPHSEVRRAHAAHHYWVATLALGFLLLALGKILGG